MRGKPTTCLRSAPAIAHAGHSLEPDVEAVRHHDEDLVVVVAIGRKAHPELLGVRVVEVPAVAAGTVKGFELVVVVLTELLPVPLRLQDVLLTRLERLELEDEEASLRIKGQEVRLLLPAARLSD